MAQRTPGGGIVAYCGCGVISGQLNDSTAFDGLTFTVHCPSCGTKLFEMVVPLSRKKKHGKRTVLATRHLPFDA